MNYSIILLITQIKYSLYLSEISSQNIEVIPPDINISDSKFTIHDHKIHYGLSALKGVGEESMIELVSNRKEKGAYKSLVDFNKRLSRSVLNKRQIEKLILSNSFKSIHKDISNAIL